VARIWFAAIYQILLGQEQGPRFGSFIALYGVAETRALIAKALSGELVREHDAFLAARAGELEPA
jgi:lysyl-tRNA synthetase class 1